MRIAYALKNYTEAAELGTRGMSINSDSSRWNLFTGYAYYYLEDYKSCIPWLLSAVNDNSIGEQGLTLLANSYLNTGNQEKPWNTSTSQSSWQRTTIWKAISRTRQSS